MKRLLVFLGLAVAAFLSWQWFLSRRTNRPLREYFSTTANSRKVAADASSKQIAALSSIAPLLAVVKPVAGLLFRGDRTASMLSSDGSIIDGATKTTDDVDDSAGAPVYLFGNDPAMN